MIQFIWTPPLRNSDELECVLSFNRWMWEQLLRVKIYQASLCYNTSAKCRANPHSVHWPDDWIIQVFKVCGLFCSISAPESLDVFLDMGRKLIFKQRLPTNMPLLFLGTELCRSFKWSRSAEGEITRSYVIAESAPFWISALGWGTKVF